LQEQEVAVQAQLLKIEAEVAEKNAQEGIREAEKARIAAEKEEQERIEAEKALAEAKAK
jgi:hypothetical protein